MPASMKQVTRRRGSRNRVHVSAEWGASDTEKGKHTTPSDSDKKQNQRIKTCNPFKQLCFGPMKQSPHDEIESMCLQNKVPTTQKKTNTTPSDNNDEKSNE